MSRLIKTSRLVLRPWEASNAGDVTNIYADPTVSRWLTPEFRALLTPAALQTTLALWHDEARTDSNCVGHWAIRKRDCADAMGGVSLQYAPPGGQSITVAWALTPSAWGHGFAVEAGDALIRWAMHEHGVLEVFAIVQPDNERAVATAQRIGMEWVAELGHLQGGRYQAYRIRHADLTYED